MLAAIVPLMEMNPPGLVIEDFNMTFEVYQKRPGQVGFTPRGVALTQDPDNLRDYVRQARRWAPGLWPTVRRHPPRVSLFTAMLTLLLIELITSGLLYAIPVAWLSRSSGRWKSPARRAVEPAEYGSAESGSAVHRTVLPGLPAAGGPGLAAARGHTGGTEAGRTDTKPNSPARVAEASHVPG